MKRLGLGHDFSRTEILKALRDPNNIPPKDMEPEKPKKVTTRQLVGQPAGPGIVSGPARVLRDASYLYSFKSTFLTVDGYLGVITINKTNPAKK